MSTDSHECGLLCSFWSKSVRAFPELFLVINSNVENVLVFRKRKLCTAVISHLSSRTLKEIWFRDIDNHNLNSCKSKWILCHMKSLCDQNNRLSWWLGWNRSINVNVPSDFQKIQKSSYQSCWEMMLSKAKSTAVSGPSHCVGLSASDWVH